MFLDLDLSAQCLTLFKQKYSTEYLPAAAQQLQLRGIALAYALITAVFTESLSVHTQLLCVVSAFDVYCTFNGSTFVHVVCCLCVSNVSGCCTVHF